MVSIKIKKGLDLPMQGEPQGQLENLKLQSGLFGLDLKPFSETVKLRLLKKVGDPVLIGEALALDKDCPERVFVSPAAGRVKEIIRGLKRRIHYIVIENNGEEKQREFSSLNPSSASREELIDRLSTGGLFAHIRHRPFDVLANPKQTPRSIFINCSYSAPFSVPVEWQVKGHEAAFAIGLEVLNKICDGATHLVYNQGSSCEAFSKANVTKVHTVNGPHPSGNTSVHIHHIDPITNSKSVIWTVNAYDVVCMGHLMKGKVHTERVISLGGTGFHKDKRGFFKVRSGSSVADIVTNRNSGEHVRIISGDVLTGATVTSEEYLGFYDFSLSAIPENMKREAFHFFKLGMNKFTASRAYLSGLMQSSGKKYEFNTNQHGEERGFIDGSIYDRVMPMNIPTMMLVKSVIAKDFEQAEELGLLEVTSSDFALPTFMCPCKLEMVEIMKNGLREYAHDILG